MTLIVLLIVLITERVALQTSFWQVSKYLNRYIEFALPHFQSAKPGTISLLILVAAPAAALAIILFFLNSGFIYFLVSLFVLAVCIGNAEARTLYRQYLNALGREDKEAQFLLHGKLAELCQDQLRTEQAKADGSDNADNSEELENDVAEVEAETTASRESDYLGPDENESIGETLIWINFVYYATPIFYFVLLGTPFVLFYATLLYLTQHEKTKSTEANIDAEQLYKWLGWMFWLPSRLVSLGFMIVGHFSNGLETWLKYAANFSKSSREMLCKVATKSDHLDEKRLDNNAQHMVKLTKRNMILFIVFVALLTLYGQIV